MAKLKLGADFANRLLLKSQNIFLTAIKTLYWISSPYHRQNSILFSRPGRLPNKKRSWSGAIHQSYDANQLTLQFMHLNNTYRALLFVFLLGLSPALFAQQQVKLERADRLKSGRNDKGPYNRLIGDVHFSQNQTLIWCDSAYLYKNTNQIEAFGHVRIKDRDSVTIRGNRLTYLGNERIARFRENVIFDNKQIRLYTDYLDYDRTENLAYYFNDGKLVDSTNIVTSDKGYYKTNTRIMSFKKDVVLTNKQDSLLSDSLVYYTRTRVVKFVAPTKVFDPQGNVATYQDGTYNTDKDRSNLQQAKLENDEYLLTGKKMIIDGLRSYYRVDGDVYLQDKDDDVIITGVKAEHWKKRGITKVYGPNALLKKALEEGDTLYLSADTLISIDSQKPSEKRFLAYHNVKIYKGDMQALSDSLAYVISDSTLFFYQNPVLWTGKNQLLADSINMVMRNNDIHKINMSTNSFMIMQDTTLIYNQIKGRKMTLQFRESKLDRVYVDGNGESIYFARDDKSQTVVGMNKIICSSMLIRFKNQKTDKVTFYSQPDAQFIPPKQLTEPGTKLKGFNWLEEYRPDLDIVLGLREAPQRPAADGSTTTKQTLPADVPPPGDEEDDDEEMNK